MPLSSTERNRIADAIVASTLKVRLHSGAPGSAGTSNGFSAGGTNYTSGVDVAASGWTVASSGTAGQVDNSAAVNFGEASADVGTVTHYSLFRGNVYVGWGTVPSTVIENGDSFSINAGSIDITVTTT